MEDEKFTNKNELEYPTEEDIVDIKVLNNNTRLLNEQKANVDDIQNALDGVAKESSEKNIENIVKATQSTVNTVNSNVATNKTNIENIKSNVGTINTNVNNIKSNITTINNNINTANNNLNSILERGIWFARPNLKSSYNYNLDPQSYTSWKSVLDVTGSGSLISASVYSLFSKQNDTTYNKQLSKMGIKIEIDNKIIMQIEVNPSNKTPNTIYTPIKIGIFQTDYMTLSGRHSSDEANIVLNNIMPIGHNASNYWVNIVETYDFSTTLHVVTDTTKLKCQSYQTLFFGRFIDDTAIKFNSKLKVSLIGATQSTGNSTSNNATMSFTAIYSLN